VPGHSRAVGSSALWAGNNPVFEAGETRVGAHARRYFFDARLTDPERSHDLPFGTFTNSMPIPFLNVDGSGVCAEDRGLIVDPSVFTRFAPTILP
jgi:hypothetical protein